MRNAYKCTRQLRTQLRLGAPCAPIAVQRAMTATANPPSLNWGLLRQEVDKQRKKAKQAILQLSKHAELNKCEEKKALMSDKLKELELKVERFELLYADLEKAPLQADLDTIDKEKMAQLAQLLHIPLAAAAKPAVSRRGKPVDIANSPPRRPYVCYTSSDGILIRVGRSAVDNDALSLRAEHRDDEDWWLHVAGHSGSHVVIRSHDNDLPKKYPNTLSEAAFLAAKNSKCPSSSKAVVSFTRCKAVSKRSSDPNGLVRLNVNHVSTTSVYVSRMEIKMKALLETKHF